MHYKLQSQRPVARGKCSPGPGTNARDERRDHVELGLPTARELALRPRRAGTDTDALALPAARARAVRDLLTPCWQVGEREPLDFLRAHRASASRSPSRRRWGAPSVRPTSETEDCATHRDLLPRPRLELRPLAHAGDEVEPDLLLADDELDVVRYALLPLWLDI